MANPESVNTYRGWTIRYDSTGRLWHADKNGRTVCDHPLRKLLAKIDLLVAGHDLQRFLDAQDTRTYNLVQDELSQGRKLTHWMWFVFPQIKGLGKSAMSQKYAINSKEEARAYLDHPILGARLIGCTALVLSADDRTALEIFSAPDVVKFHSCMTLFESVATPRDPYFRAALTKFFSGKRDTKTLHILKEMER